MHLFHIASLLLFSLSKCIQDCWMLSAQPCKYGPRQSWQLHQQWIDSMTGALRFCCQEICVSFGIFSDFPSVHHAADPVEFDHAGDRSWCFLIIEARRFLPADTDIEIKHETKSWRFFPFNLLQYTFCHIISYHNIIWILGCLGDGHPLEVQS